MYTLRVCVCMYAYIDKQIYVDVPTYTHKYESSAQRMYVMVWLMDMIDERMCGAGDIMDEWLASWLCKMVDWWVCEFILKWILYILIWITNIIENRSLCEPISELPVAISDFHWYPDICPSKPVEMLRGTYQPQEKKRTLLNNTITLFSPRIVFLSGLVFSLRKSPGST